MTNSARLKVAITPGSFEGKPHFLARQVESDSPDSGRNSTIESRFGISVQLDEADIALFPFDLSDVLRMQTPSHEALIAVIDSNRERGLRTVCVMWHDFSLPLTVGQPDAIVFRPSMVRGLEYAEEFPIPTNFQSKDLYASAHHFGRHSPRPRIGFMGSVPKIATPAELHQLGDATKNAFRGYEKSEILPNPMVRTPINIGTVIRNRGLAILRKSEIIEADIVTRDAYFGFYSADERLQMRQEYVEHMMRNDYIYCPRGAGNYSTRLFETVAAGRVPILIDTNLAMPFADVIPWQEIAVWVPMNEIDHLDEHVVAFHARLGADGYRALQSQLRSVFDNYLSRDGVDRYLESFLLERL